MENTALLEPKGSPDGDEISGIRKLPKELLGDLKPQEEKKNEADEKWREDKTWLEFQCKSRTRKLVEGIREIVHGYDPDKIKPYPISASLPATEYFCSINNVNGQNKKNAGSAGDFGEISPWAVNRTPSREEIEEANSVDQESERGRKIWDTINKPGQQYTSYFKEKSGEIITKRVSDAASRAEAIVADIDKKILEKIRAENGEKIVSSASNMGTSPSTGAAANSSQGASRPASQPLHSPFPSSSRQALTPPPPMPDSQAKTLEPDRAKSSARSFGALIKSTIGKLFGLKNK